MKNNTILSIILLTITLGINSCELTETTQGKPTKEELDEKFKNSWDKPEYSISNTAKDSEYLTQAEKEVFYYLNLARLNPSLFAETYAEDYDGANGFTKGYAFDERKQTLIDELMKLEPLELINPDYEMFLSAKCFADEGGKLGTIGHDRSGTSCSKIHDAECCTYGGSRNNGLSIIMAFLIDAGENNAALGHRRICLGEYSFLGVAIRPHQGYDFNAVLDFKR